MGVSESKFSFTGEEEMVVVDLPTFAYVRREIFFIFGNVNFAILIFSFVV